MQLFLQRRRRTKYKSVVEFIASSFLKFGDVIVTRPKFNDNMLAVTECLKDSTGSSTQVQSPADLDLSTFDFYWKIRGDNYPEAGLRGLCWLPIDDIVFVSQKVF